MNERTNGRKDGLGNVRTDDWTNDEYHHVVHLVFLFLGEFFVAIFFFFSLFSAYFFFISFFPFLRLLVIRKDRKYD